MIDREKVIRGLERCLKCSMIPTSSAEELKAYIDCEYTVGLYCGKDKLLFETLELLKKRETVVRCKDCKYSLKKRGKVYCSSILLDKIAFVDADWFCADGVNRDE